MKKFLVLIVLIFSINLFGKGVEAPSLGIKQGGYFILSLPYEENIKVEFPKSHTTLKTYKVKDNAITLVPVHYSTDPGTYIVKAFKDDKVIYEEEVVVMDANFKKSYITVNKTMAKKKSAKNVKKMINHAREARSNSSSNSEWSNRFATPLKARVSSPFGATRYVNKKVSGYHSGSDFAVSIGEDVFATNSGTVVLAMHLTSTGNTVIIDHGLNLFSSYAHLDSLNISVGDSVYKGEIVGKSGNTGFTTGPHLHFTMSIGNTFVDPFLFIDKVPFKY